MMCLICDQETKYNHFSSLYQQHIKKTHNVEYKDYYDKYIKTDVEGVCKSCGCKTKWKPNSAGYNSFCTRSCRASYEMKKVWQNSEFKNRMLPISIKNIKGQNSWKSHPEKMFQIMSDRLKKLWQNENYRNHMISIFKNNWKNDDYRRSMSENLSNTLKKLWQDSDYRQKIVKQGIELYEERNKNPKFGYAKYKNIFYKNNLRMRSSWEVSFAEDLDEINIDWNYEYNIINMDDGHKYHPDFYLPEINLYIEIKPQIFVDDRVIYKIEQTIKSGYNIIICTEVNWDEILCEIKIMKDKLV